MTEFDVGRMVVIHGLIISILLITSSQKLGSYAGVLGFSRRVAVEKYTALAIKTVGIVWALLTGSLLLFSHILRFGVD